MTLFPPENIKDNNYTLKDITNRTTRWGVWTPSVINFNQTWGDEHGLNSLEILSGLLSAFRITGKVEYMEAWQVGMGSLKCLLSYTCTCTIYMYECITLCIEGLRPINTFGL